MKKYKFKLEGLLKIRSFKEEICKTEMGKLQKSISECKQSIHNEFEGIRAASSAHNRLLENGMGGREAQFFPRFIQGKEANIELLKKEIIRLQQLVEEKIKELAKLRADVKVIEKLKEKDFQSFKKEEFKKQELLREESILIWQGYNKQRIKS